MNKYVNINGDAFSGRRNVSRPTLVFDEDVRDPSRLADIIRKLSVRVSELEVKAPVAGVEFECDIDDDSGSGQNYSFEHNLKCPVRYYVVHWVGDGDTAAPSLMYQTESTSTVLVLKSYSVGRVVLRIEPAQAGVS
jgi:hypothetical protein